MALQILRKISGVTWYIRYKDKEDELLIPKVGDIINRQAAVNLDKL